MEVGVHSDSFPFYRISSIHLYMTRRRIRFPTPSTWDEEGHTGGRVAVESSIFLLQLVPVDRRETRSEERDRMSRDEGGVGKNMVKG